VIPVEEALSIVLGATSPLPPEEIDFTEARGRILFEDVVSDIDMPPFARSAVDGFALRAEDLREVPATLELVGTIPAGTFPRMHIEPGQAAAIMTGAPVPEGADAVSMVEQSREEGGRVTILERVARGQNVAPRGSESRAGDVVLRRGARMDPAAVAVLATVGKTRLVAGRRPKVAIAATGDELVSPAATPGPGQIRNSNGFSLLAQCGAVGIEALYLGVAVDTPASIREHVERGLGADVLLLSGGVSAGRFDLVEQVLAEFGVRILVDAVALKPGKPLVFGVTKHGKLVFGLPGNPVSTMVTFELFVRCALARLEGALDPVRSPLRARLTAPISNRGARRAYLPGWVRPESGGELSARPIPTRGSADIVAFAKSNALVIVPENSDRLDVGEWVRVHPLDSFLSKEDRWLEKREDA
jgi:molybdopterin molybdotransferase